MAPSPEQVAALFSRCHLFRGLSAEKLAFAAACFTPLQFSADQIVFEQGETPKQFFFVFGGRLKMTHLSRALREENMFGFLDEGDFFGQDLFQENNPQRVSVQAVTEASLLGLDLANARKLFEEIPELVSRMQMILESYNLRFHVPLSWVNPEEMVYYVTHRHSIYLVWRLLPWLAGGAVLLLAFLALLQVPHMTVLLLILGLGLLVVAVMLVWYYVDETNDFYIVTGKRVVLQEKIILLYDSRQESPLEQVQSITVDTTQIGRMFNFGNVVVRTFSGTILFHGVPSPNDLVAVIQEMQKRTQSSLRQAELRQIEEILARRIGLLPQKPAGPARAQAEGSGAKVTRLQKWMSDLFHLRLQTGETIQYRTHWWILVKKIWFQSLALLTVSAAQLWMLVQSASGALNNFPVLGAFLGLCVVWLAIFLWWLYLYIDWHNDVYLINNEQVVDVNRKPFGNEEKRVAQVKNILSVEYKRLGLLGLMLNYGTVYIRVGEATFTFDDIFNPSEVQREIFHRISQRNLRERQSQGEAERQRMADWISAYHRITHKGG